MKKILMITTGGTIVSEPGENGLVPKMGADAIVGLVPAVADLCDVSCIDVLNIDSSNVVPSNWSLVAQSVAKNYHDFDGFVITHGTDTMAYSASALTFMLRNLAKPVILTGAQIPIAEEETDGKRNIYDAFCAAVSDLCGVFIVFDGKIIKGDHAKKMHTQCFNAFYSVNAPYTGIVADGNVVFESREVKPCGEFKCMPKTEGRILELKLLPGMSGDIVSFAVSRGYKGFIVEGFGAGGIPSTDAEFCESLKHAVSIGIPVVCTSQCMYDGVDLTKYEPGVDAVKLGALSAGQMTSEAAAVKLMWAIGNAKSYEEIINLFTGV